MSSASVNIFFGLASMANALGGDLTAASTASAQRYITVGTGNCLPNRPQWKGTESMSRVVCQDECNNVPGCIGYDSDDDTCRLRFESNTSAALPPQKFTFHDGDEGIGFTDFTGRGSWARRRRGSCFQKNKQQAKNHYIFLGAGNCAPNMPQWFSSSFSFENCIDLCDVAEGCIGFDYDEEGGECRVRFEDLYDEHCHNWLGCPIQPSTASPPEEYTAQDPTGTAKPRVPLFTGVSGRSSATCFQKVSRTELKLAMEDCGENAKFEIKGLTPESLTLGQKMTMMARIGKRQLIDQTAGVSDDGWTISMDARSAVVPRYAMLSDCDYKDASAPTTCLLDFDTRWNSFGSLTFHALDLPLKTLDNFQVKVDIQLPTYRARKLFPITTTAVMKGKDGQQLFCMRIVASLPTDKEEGRLQTSGPAPMSTTTMTTTVEQMRRLATEIV